jgi:kynurenine formamidase
VAAHRRIAILSVSLAVVACSVGVVVGAAFGSEDVAAPRSATSLPGFTGAVFLSHLNDPSEVPVFPGDPAFSLRTVFTVPEDGFFLRYVKEGEHTGTHYSAPCHFHVEARCAGQLNAGDFILPAVVIDVREAVDADVDHEVTVAELRAWEAEHGQIPAGAAVLLWTGCDRFWGTALSPDLPTYYNCGSAAGRFRQPGFSRASVRWLIDTGVLADRGALGTDTFGPDPGSDAVFKETFLTLRKHRFTLENLTNLGELPATGAWIVIGGPRNRNGSGAPSSVIGLVP